QLREQGCDHAVTGLMPQPFQFVGQLAHAFGDPAPWRLWSSSSRRFDTTLQVHTKRLISLDGGLRPPPDLRVRPEASCKGRICPAARSSLQPAVMVGRETPVAWATTKVPP